MDEHHLRQMSSLLHPSRVTETPHREPLLYVSSTVDGHILCVGQDGLVSVWSTNLKLKKTSLILDENENKLRNRSLKWVSDSILMAHYNKLIIGTCNREIRLYELSNLEPYCQIVGLETMPLHLDYSVRGEGECVISYGDEQGCVNILLINFVAETLRNWTKYPPVEEIPTISINAINDQGNITFIRWKVHNDWVTKIKYIHSMESIISSSNDDCTALVIGCVSRTKNVKHRLKTLMGASTVSHNKFALPATASPARRFQCDESVFKVHKGVKTFDFCRESNILVTGGLDRNIRLWNPYVPGWPLAILRGHSSPIGFLCIAHGSTKIFSVSLDSTIKVWDIEDHSCLLTVMPKVSQIRGEMEACYFSPDVRGLYVAAETLGLLHFQYKENQNHDSGTSHNKPIFCCQYNQQLQHVISCSEDSVIKVWDLKTGRLIIKVCEAHGGTAVTCMALDAGGKRYSNIYYQSDRITPAHLQKSGGRHTSSTRVLEARRLITGGGDGSLKKWDSSTLGYIHTIKQATSSADEVTACTYADLYDNRYIISVGWGQKISIFLDINDEVVEGSYPQLDWIRSVEKGHRDDILCIASCPPHFLATSSFDGEVLIWNLISGHLCSRLHAVDRAVREGETEDLTINKIIFLLSRLEKKKTAAVLVASGPRGYIAFWNTYGRGSLFAYFSNSKERSTVNDLAVDDKDFLLCAGDQLGFLYIWNIAEYAINGPEAKPPVCERNIFIHVLYFLPSVQYVLTLVSRPPSFQIVLHSWNPHHCSITSISLISEHQLLLTTSLDCNAKLWSLKREYIGTFGQREPWNIKEKSSWGLSDSNPSSENSSDSFGQEPTRTFDTQKKSEMDAEIIPDTCTLKMIIDNEIAEELKQRQIDRLHRSKQFQWKPTQHDANRINSYHSLPLCELADTQPAFHKPNLAELDDPFQMEI